MPRTLLILLSVLPAALLRAEPAPRLVRPSARAVPLLRPAARAVVAPAIPALDPLRPLPWGAGESMTFAIRLAGIEGGRAALSVGAPSRALGRRTLKLRGLSETVPFISTFRKLREEVVTQIDLEAGLLPIHHSSDRELASKRRKIEVRYERGRLLQTIDRDGAISRRERVVAPPVYDGPSILYALRSAVIPEKGRVLFRVLGGPHLYRVEIWLAGKERVRALGKLHHAIRLDGVAQEIDDAEKPARGERPRRFSIWLGTDAHRLPLRAVGETKLGLVEASLSSCSPARRPIRGRAPRLAAL